MQQKYIKCFTKEKAEQLKRSGYEELYNQNGVFYFANNENLTIKFSNNDVLKDTKLTATLNF